MTSTRREVEADSYEQRFKAMYPNAECLMVTSVIRVRYRVFAEDRYWGYSQKSIEAAWHSALNEAVN